MSPAQAERLLSHLADIASSLAEIAATLDALYERLTPADEDEPAEGFSLVPN